MANIDYDVKQDNVYKLGMNSGFFAAFLLFASVFYFIMAFFNKLPHAIKYYHILFFVIITYFIRFVALKLKNE